MRLCIVLDSASDGVIKRVAMRRMKKHCVVSRNSPQSNDAVAQEFHNRVNKLLGKSVPIDQVGVLVMHDHPIARRIRDNPDQFRKGYVIESVDVFLDLVLHKVNQKSATQNPDCLLSKAIKAMPLQNITRGFQKHFQSGKSTDIHPKTPRRQTKASRRTK